MALGFFIWTILSTVHSLNTKRVPNLLITIQKGEKQKHLKLSLRKKNGIMEARTGVWWNEQEKKSFYNMPICRSKYSVSLGLVFQFSFCPALSDYLPSGRSRHVWAISTALFYEINPYNNLPINQDFVISEVMQSHHHSRHQTGYWLQMMWVGRMGTKQPEWNRMNFQTSHTC